MPDPIEQIRDDHARRTTPGSTHYEGCWKHHYVCTVGLLLDALDECERDNDDLHTVAGQLTDRMVAMQKVVDAADRMCARMKYAGLNRSGAYMNANYASLRGALDGLDGDDHDH